MGTERTDYVIYGHKWDSTDEYNAYMNPRISGSGEDDAYEWGEPYDENDYQDAVRRADRLTILYDGMNGDYVIAGYIMAKGCLDGDSCSGLELTDCTPSRKLKRTVEGWLLDTFGLVADPKVYALTHWH